MNRKKNLRDIKHMITLQTKIEEASQITQRAFFKTLNEKIGEKKRRGI